MSRIWWNLHIPARPKLPGLVQCQCLHPPSPSGAIGGRGKYGGIRCGETDTRGSIKSSLELIAMTLFPTPVSCPLSKGGVTWKHCHRQNVTPHHFFDYINFFGLYHNFYLSSHITLSLENTSSLDIVNYNFFITG